MATWNAGAADQGWGDGDYVAPVAEDPSDNGAEDASPVDEERKPRLSRKAMEGLQTDRQQNKEKFISVWMRDSKTKALVEFVPKFPREAARVFSEVWKKQLDGPGSALLIQPSFIDQGFTEPVKRIIEWIELCVEEGNDVKFPEIVDDNALYLLIEILVLANKLKIPEMSLQAQLKKAAMKYARHSLIEPWHIAMIYDEASADYLGESEQLREAAAASIFEAWWNRVLDAPEYDEYCSFLEQLRAEFPKLDEDLNKRFDDKKEYIDKKRDEKRQARANGGVGGGGHGPKHEDLQPSSVSDYPETTGPDGGWTDATAAVTDVQVDEWGLGGGGEPTHTTKWTANVESGLVW